MTTKRLSNAARVLALVLTATAAAPAAGVGQTPASPDPNAAATPEELLATKPVDPGNPDWPCVQHKVMTLTAVQMWDGPPVDDIKGWNDNDEIRKLIPGLVSRRASVEAAGAAIKAFAEKQPADKRDASLTLLFAGVLDAINTERRGIIDGIERFQRRQVARALELQRQGSEIFKMKGQAAKAEGAAADDAKKKVAEAEERYTWDARVFQERQRNVPLACEIPVLIEQRIFELAREIRSHMKS